MQLRLGESAVALIILLVFVLAFAGAWFLQARVEQDLPAPDTLPPALQEQISRYEVERLKAQIKQIRSDTAGSLFSTFAWNKFGTAYPDGFFQRP